MRKHLRLGLRVQGSGSVLGVLAADFVEFAFGGQTRGVILVRNVGMELLIGHKAFGFHGSEGVKLLWAADTINQLCDATHL